MAQFDYSLLFDDKESFTFRKSFKWKQQLVKNEQQNF
jgi:hypothetical protein